MYAWMSHCRRSVVLLALLAASARGQFTPQGTGTHGQVPQAASTDQSDAHAGHDHAPSEGHDAMPLPEAEAATSASFLDSIDLSPLSTLSVQHNQTLKTLDTWARGTLVKISGKSTWNDRDALTTLFDISMRPGAYVDEPIIKIRNVAIRHDLADKLPGYTKEQKQSLIKGGVISLRFLLSDEVRQILMQLQSTAAFKQEGVRELLDAGDAMYSLTAMRPDFPALALIAPADGSNTWQTIARVQSNVPEMVEAFKLRGLQLDAPIPGYEARAVAPVVINAWSLLGAWQSQDSKAAQTAIAGLAAALPQAAPAQYPSQLRREAEVTYNRLFKLTLPGAACYFVAAVLFVMASRTGGPRLRLWALRVFVAGLLIHTIGIAIRWWLVQKSTQDWFHSIPIKNQFESVLMSAWFGAVLGLLLEVGLIQAAARKLFKVKTYVGAGRNLIGAAASVTGTLSLLAIFAAPFVFKREIGGEINQSGGILMSYWLYIHVTLVVASYALITMSFALGLWWLVTYYSRYRTLSRLANQRMLSADAADLRGSDDGYSLAFDGGGAATTSVGMTLAQMLFLRRVSVVATPRIDANADAVVQRKLAVLDQCNLVVLQLAFWLLGLGIICGAIWADVSWGRPWGWDPKETFALVTWIVYLVIVHVRIATKYKAWWTALLSLVGFGVMLFNWIGVNFFLVGLHSYAT